jgi:antirestriction protein ArdC
MATIKQFQENLLLQLEYVIITGKDSNQLLHQVKGKARNSKVEFIFPGFADIKSFKVAAVRELLHWAQDIEQATGLIEQDILQAFRNRWKTTILSKVCNLSSAQLSPERFQQLSIFSIDTIREIFSRIAEIRKLNVPNSSSISELYKFFSRDSYEGISINLGDCIDLGFPTKSIYHDIIDQILASLDSNIGIYKQPWHSTSSKKIPQNAISHRSYTGINIISLWHNAQKKGFFSQYWATRNQWTKNGWTVPPGVIATPVIKYFNFGADNSNFRIVIVPVFNRNQVIGPSINKYDSTNNVVDIKKINNVIDKTGALIESGNWSKNGQWEAFYDPAKDFITMPPKSAFHTDPTYAYYATLLHELIHWTGHHSRLARKLDNTSGDLNYAREELIAELGAAFLCAKLGIADFPRPDHAQYLSFWLSHIKGKGRALLDAASKASIATSFIMGR